MTQYLNEERRTPQPALVFARRLGLAALLATMVAGCGGAPNMSDARDDGDAAPAESMATDPDGRTALMLPAQGRHLVLLEMRTMLASVQGFVAAAARGDTAGMRTAAQASGVAAARDMDPAMQQRLPPEFLRLGMGTHVAWDSLAMDVSRGVSTSDALGRLGTIMSNCVACHDQFRINLER